MRKLPERQEETRPTPALELGLDRLRGSARIEIAEKIIHVLLDSFFEAI